MEENIWIEKCANRFIERALCTLEDAIYLAELCLEGVEGDTSYCPVETADEEMSYWD